MKITKVEIKATDVPFKKSNQENVGEIALGKWQICRFVIVKVHTDEGIVGYGESAPFARLSQLGQKPIVDILADYVAPAVIGMDPFQVEAIWQAMDRATPYAAQAKGAIDMALYDIMGKKTGMPAYNFMGGLVRREIPLQAIVTIDTPENMRAASLDWISQGYRTIRIKLGVGSLKQDMELVRNIREAIGDDVKLRVDPNQAYSVKDALKMIPVLEDNDVEIYEQPISWTDLDGLAEVNAATHIPVMPHESMSSIYDVKELMERKAVSLFTLKTDRPGGITKARITRDLAELYNIPCVVMSSVELGISTFASMQFAATLKAMPFACEASGPLEIEDIDVNSNRIRDGKFIVPDGPGFGAEIDEEKLEHYTKYTVVCDESAKVQD